jgi:leucyl aminopeptidase
MSVKFSLTANQPHESEAALFVAVLPAETKLPTALRALDKLAGGVITRALGNKDFTGAKDEGLLLVGNGEGPTRILLVGSGRGDVPGVTRAAALAGRKATAMGVAKIEMWAPDLTDERLEGAIVGVSLGSWEFTELKRAPATKKAPLSAVTLYVANVAKSKAALSAGAAVAEGQRLARRLAMLPGNICTPDFIAATARDMGKRLKMKSTVLGRREMAARGMGSFLAVAQGTTQDPKLIVLEYNGGKKGERPVALIGKGLCFDTGGVSIKPAPGMELMKFDMSGAAGVLGAMEAIARMQLKINVVALVGSTTNVVDGDAVKPGDVVTAGDGTTIEIQNTDAEGRLVLADVLHFAKQYRPTAMVDAATLTCAVVIALGNVTVGVMGNDQSVVDEVLAAGRRGGEVGWQLPLFEEYRSSSSPTSPICETSADAARERSPRGSS